MSQVKCCFKNILESGTVSLPLGVENSSYPLYRLYDRDIGKVFKITAAETLEIVVDQGANNKIAPDKIIIPKGHNLFTAGSEIDILVSNDNFVNESISLARNLVRYSEQLDNAAWIKSNSPVVTANDITAPDGQVTADKISNMTNTLHFYQGISGLLRLQRYEPSFYIKKITSSGTFSLYNEAAVAYGNWGIDLAAIGSGWERITRDHPAVTIGAEFIAKSDGYINLSFYCSEYPIELFLWGVQLERGETTTNYIAQSISHNNDLVFDIPYSPVNNLVRYSEQLDNAAWINVYSSVVTANDATAPDGQVTADKISDMTNGIYIYQQISGLLRLQRYEPSFYIKKITSSGSLHLYNANAGGYGHWEINLAAIGSGWERITRDHPAVTIDVEFIAKSDGFLNPLFYCGVYPIELYIWGVQLVAGLVPLEYQVTKSVSSVSPRRYIKIKITAPSAIPYIPELFVTQTYEWERNPSRPTGNLLDRHNVERDECAGGQTRYLVHGDSRRYRNYPQVRAKTAQQVNAKAMYDAWAGSKPFWLCDHNGEWIYGEILSMEMSEQASDMFPFSFEFLEVLP